MSLNIQNIIQELNALTRHFDNRSLVRTDTEDAMVEQFVALGILFIKWMEANPPEAQEQFWQTIREIGQRIIGQQVTLQ